MARKQSDYLAALLSDEQAGQATTAPAPAPFEHEPPTVGRERLRGTTLLGRESALARVASGEVRQITQLSIDPAKVRIWPGNARSYTHLSYESCQELIDAIIAEGGQKVPAIVRRIEGDPEHDYEVIAGTRRHWSITWLRANSYPDMQFLAQVANLDDEAAFRLADIENRARKDVSDLERARNYAAALRDHYGNHAKRMAERLRLSQGWLSKMLKVATLPESVVAAFASPADVQLKPAYGLAQALDDKDAAKAITKAAGQISREQEARRQKGSQPIPASDVLKRLLEAPLAGSSKAEPFMVTSSIGRPLLTVQSANRQGVTIRLHSGSGATDAEIATAVQEALTHLAAQRKGLQQ